ncbi:beta-galactoside alpha-2,6-sialyltransferase 2 isoform X2 [Electrophorus electricus]|nr:beta-galactoside alpha-2,6-sialyltransferase 2 isoform X2 [Electrophorus electricus]
MWCNASSAKPRIAGQVVLRSRGIAEFGSSNATAHTLLCSHDSASEEWSQAVRSQLRARRPSGAERETNQGLLLSALQSTPGGARQGPGGCWEMKSGLKKWRRLALGLMLTWVLLFFALFTYFMESRVDQHSAAGLAHADTRRLTSVQGNTRSRQEPHAGPTSPVAGGQRGRGPEQSPSREAMAGGLSPELFPRIDHQILPAWSAIGTRDVGPRPGAATREQRRQRDVQEEEEEEVMGEEVEGNEEEQSFTTRRAAADGLDDSDLDEYYSSKSTSVVQRLWKGNVSLGMLSPRLQRAMKDYLSSNKHGVAYRGRRSPRQSSKQVLCELKKRSRVRTLDGAELPFSTLGWRKIVPDAPLRQLYGSGFHSCAVVTSAGAILHSGLGREIDSHDAVLRFNSAPTEGYERDVGEKTTIRIINSQIMANPTYRFNSSLLYRNVTLVAWDPAPYKVNLREWYKSPDYNLFTPYVEHRKKHPTQPFYILHPTFTWRLWDVVQGNTLENIQPNPPSSGFIGIVLMMSLCEEVHVYEYIPSLRQTELCHYHERYYDAACTLGAYHPLLYEKMLIQRINSGSEGDLKHKGA